MRFPQPSHYYSEEDLKAMCKLFNCTVDMSCCNYAHNMEKKFAKNYGVGTFKEMRSKYRAAATDYIVKNALTHDYSRYEMKLARRRENNCEEMRIAYTLIAAKELDDQSSDTESVDRSTSSFLADNRFEDEAAESQPEELPLLPGNDSLLNEDAIFCWHHREEGSEDSHSNDDDDDNDSPAYGSNSEAFLNVSPLSSVAPQTVNTFSEIEPVPARSYLEDSALEFSDSDENDNLELNSDTDDDSGNGDEAELPRLSQFENYTEFQSGDIVASTQHM